MIAKRAKKSSNRSVVRTFCYVVDTKKSTLDRNSGLTGKVSEEDIRFTNINAQTPGDALLEMQLLQSLNTRSKSDKNYHLIVSFPIGEVPDKDILENIEDELCKSIGLDEHQRISAIHNDTDHYHLHILINKINPTSFNNIEPFYDKKSLMKKCDELEVKFNLQSTNHGLSNKEKQKQKTEQEIYQDQQTLQNFVSENLLPQIESCNSWNEIHELVNEYGISLNRKGQGIVFTSEEVSVKASSVAREISLNNLEKKLGDFEEEKTNDDKRAVKGRTKNRDGGRAESNRHNRKSSRVNLSEQGHFGSSSEEKTLDSMQHLSRCDMVRNSIGVEVFLSDHEIGHIQQRRADAIEGLRRNRGGMGGDATSRVKYDKDFHKKENPLFQEYLKKNAASTQSRKALRNKLKTEREQFKEELQKWYEARADRIKKSNRTTAQRKEAWRNLFEKKKKFQQQFNEKQKTQRKETPKNQSWHDYLQEQALNGNTEALKQLRNKVVKDLRKYDKKLGVSDKDIAKKTFIYKDLDPKLRSNGSVVYEFKDGGKVLDRKDDLKIESDSQASIYMALLMAKDKFGYRPISVSGSDDFKESLIKTAVEHNISIKFEDVQMEERRQQLSSEINEHQNGESFVKNTEVRTNVNEESKSRGKSR